VPRTDITIKRRNLTLGNGYAFTAYYCQGMSFKEEPWLSDVSPPAYGPVDRASLAVVLSRYARWSMFRQYTKLWEDGDAAGRQRVVDFYYKQKGAANGSSRGGCQMPADLRADLARLSALAAQTEARLLEQLRHHLPPHLLP
jgi:hypothetical protein